MLLIVTTSPDAFALNRKGFVSSVSVGFAPTTKFGFNGVSESGMALVGGVAEGFGWDDRNIITVEGKISARNSDYYTALGQTYTHLDGSQLGDQKITQTFVGLGWYHYFSSRTKSLYTHVAIGAHSFRVKDFSRNDPGLGWTVGAGYQFADRFQAGVFASFGRTKEADVRYDHTQFGFLVTLLPY